MRIKRVVCNEFSGFIDHCDFHAGTNSRIKPKHGARTGGSCEHQVFQIVAENIDGFGFGFLGGLAE